MKRCEDCKHYTASQYDKRFNQCNRESPIKHKTGKYMLYTRLCDIERSAIWPMSFFSKTCGKSGRYWTPKGKSNE